MTSLMMSPEGDNSDVRVATVMSLVAIFGKSDSSTHSSNAQESERLEKPPWLQAGERGRHRSVVCLMCPLRCFAMPIVPSHSCMLMILQNGFY